MFGRRVLVRVRVYCARCGAAAYGKVELSTYQAYGGHPPADFIIPPLGWTVWAGSFYCNAC